MSNLEPQKLTTLLDLAGFENSSYLALYLCAFGLENHQLASVDYDHLESCLESEKITEDHKIKVEMGLTQGEQAQIYLLEHDDLPGTVLVVIPGLDSVISELNVFGPKSLLAVVEKMLADNPLPTHREFRVVQ